MFIWTGSTRSTFLFSWEVIQGNKNINKGRWTRKISIILYQHIFYFYLEYISIQTVTTTQFVIVSSLLYNQKIFSKKQLNTHHPHNQLSPDIVSLYIIWIEMLWVQFSNTLWPPKFSQFHCCIQHFEKYNQKLLSTTHCHILPFDFYLH